MNSRRRNGKPASCESCRRHKVRCDHARPVCSRCKERGEASNCFYHPAPLTRPRRHGSNSLVDCFSARLTAQGRDLHRNETSLNVHMSMRPNDHVASLHTAARNRPILSGYFGPMSFLSPLTDAGDLAPAGESLESNAIRDVSPSYWVQKVIEILHAIGDFTIVEGLVREYYNLSQSAVIPAPFVVNSLDPLEATLKDCADKNYDESIKELSVQIIHNTAEIFEVPSSITGKEFHTLYSGSAIRLEIIGIICSIAGRAGYLGLARAGLGKYVSVSQFARAMLAASNIIIHLCKILTPLNDLTIWLVHEDLLLSDLVEGDSSLYNHAILCSDFLLINFISGPHSWSRLGELSTDLFALGYHRDVQEAGATPEAPEFLIEARRRLFAAAYQLDKSLATFLGRPPRIPKRYTDCKIPKDLSDDALATDKRDLSHLRGDLDEDGWNTGLPFQRATWIRVRYIMMTFRDEILEVSMQNITPETTKILTDISYRSHEAWEKLPTHIREGKSMQLEGKKVDGWLMSYVVYLGYLYNDFLIQRLLAGKSNRRGSTALLSVSAEILSTVLSIGAHREQYVDLRPDFIWLLLLYGFPSASLLMKALQHHKRTGEQFLYEGSRAQLIRHLSVFISHMETIVLPDNANYTLLQRTSQIFTKIIDEVLEPDAYAPGSNASDESWTDIDQMIAIDELDLFNTMDLGCTANQWVF